MHFQQKQNRAQIQMLSLEQMVAKDSYARVIDAFVDTVDFKALDFTNTTLNSQGNLPYHPSDLLKLYLYGYQSGIRSSRKLAHCCRTNVEVMWLLGGLHPHFKTICNFRKDNKKAFTEVFRHFLLILKNWKLIEGKDFAVDSFKIRAQNSLKNNFNDKKIKRHLDYIDQKIADYQDTLDQEDLDGKTTKEIVDKIAKQKEKQVGYQALKQALSETEDGQISTTDTDSRGVVFQRTSVKIGYNIQSASDTKNKLLVAFDTGDVNDTHQLANMTQLAMENTQSKQCTVLADKGYHTGVQLAKCEALQAKTFVSPKSSASSVTNGVYSVDLFTYNPTEDTYTCPQGNTMSSNGVVYSRRSKKKNAHDISFKHYKTKACKHCPIKTQCTNQKYGRVLQRSQHQDAIDRNNDRLMQHPDYYRNRQQIIEHQFGTLKRQWHLDHTLVKTKPLVLTEIAIAFTAYNLRRSLSILGLTELIRRLKAVFDSFLCCHASTTLSWIKSIGTIISRSINYPTTKPTLCYFRIN